MTISSGTVSTGGTALGTGSVTLGPGGTLAVNANSALTGFYYQNVATITAGNTAYFNSLPTLQTHLAAPDAVAHRPEQLEGRKRLEHGHQRRGQRLRKPAKLQ